MTYIQAKRLVLETLNAKPCPECGHAILLNSPQKTPCLCFNFCGAWEWVVDQTGKSSGNWMFKSSSRPDDFNLIEIMFEPGTRAGWGR